MIQLLARADRASLQHEIGRIPLVSGILYEQITAFEAASFLVAYYGSELLETASMRQLLFSIIPINRLNALSREFDLPESPYTYDAATILSTVPWNTKSALPLKIRENIFEAFGETIPDEYMPKDPPIKPPSIEEIHSEKRTPLFDYQRQMSDRVYSLFSSPDSRAMLQMPTGSGKTRTVMDALVRWMTSSKERGVLVLWMAHSEELCEQAIETFKRTWNNYGEGATNVYRLWGAQKFIEEQLSYGIIVAGLQKLHSLSFRKDAIFEKLRHNVTVIVMDEAHKALAPTYKNLIETLTKGGHKKALLGLSATPGRGILQAFANERLAAMFGNQLLSPTFDGDDAITALRKLGVLAKLRREVLLTNKNYYLTDKEQKFISDFFEFPASVLNKFEKDQERNQLIVASLIELVKHDNQCIVFACGVEHAKLISAMVAVRGVSSCSITSDMRHSNRVRSIEEFKQKKIKVIINYGILTTGFDAPNVGAILIARPTASIVLYSQMIGRGLRGPKVGGKEECIVVDILDNIHGFRSEAEVYSYFEDYWK